MSITLKTRKPSLGLPQLIVLCAAILFAVSPASTLQAQDISEKQKIEYPDVWGAELPVPERSYHTNGAPDIYRDRQGDILLVYHYYVEDPIKGRVIKILQNLGKIRFEGRAYNFFEQRVVKTFNAYPASGFKGQPPSDEDVFLKSVGAEKIRNYYFKEGKLHRTNLGNNDEVDFLLSGGNCINTLQGRLQILDSSGNVKTEKTLFKLLKKPRLVSTGDDLCFHSPSYGRTNEWAHGQSIQWLTDVTFLEPAPLGDGTFLAVNRSVSEREPGPIRVFRFDNQLDSPYVESLPDYFLTDDLEFIHTKLIGGAGSDANLRCLPHCFPPGSGPYEIMQQRVLEYLWPKWLAKRERIVKNLMKDNQND